MQGVFRNGTRILRDPQGQLVSVDPNAAERLMTQGVEGQVFHDVTENEVLKQDFARANSGIGGQLEGFARGAANAALAPVSAIGRQALNTAVPVANAISGAFGGEQVDPNQVNQIAARGLPALVAGATEGGSTEDKLAAADTYNRRTEQFKGAGLGSVGAGELGGMLGAGVLTGGAASAAGRALGGGLAAAGAATATEGAVYGLGAAEQAAQEAHQVDGATGEQLLIGIGLGAILGGAVGVASHGLGRVMRGASKTLDRYVEPTTASELRAPVTAAELDARLAQHWADTTGADRAFLEEVGPQNTSAEAIRKRNLIRDYENLADDAIPKVTQSVDRFERATEEIRKYVDSHDLRASGVQAMFDRSPNFSESAAKEAGLTEMRRVITAANGVLDKLTPEGQSIAKPLTDRISRFVDHANGAYSGRPGVTGAAREESAAEINARLNDLKREAQKMQVDIADLRTKNVLVGDAKMAWNAVENDIQEPLRQQLESDVWGQAGRAQFNINARYKKQIDSGDYYVRELLHDTRTKDWHYGARSKMAADSAKSAALIRKLGTAEGATSQTNINQHVRDVRDWLDAINEMHPLDSQGKRLYQEAVHAFNDFEATVGSLDEASRLRAGMDRLKRADQASLPGAIGRTVDTVTGAMSAGPMGGVVGAAGFLYRPGAAVEAAVAIQNMAKRIGVQIEKRAVGAVESSVGQRAAKGAASALRTTVNVGAAASRPKVAMAIQMFQGRHDTLQKAYDDKAGQLQAFAADPTLLIGNLSKVTGGLDSASPGMAARLTQSAQRAIQYLTAQLPAGTTSPTFFDPNRRTYVSQPDLENYARIWGAVVQPTTVLDDLTRNQATPNQLAALRAVHPETYQAIRMSVYNALADLAAKGRKVPISVAQQLDMLLELGGAGEPALSYDVADRINQIRSTNAKAQPIRQSRRRGSRSSKQLVASMQLPQESWMK